MEDSSIEIVDINSTSPKDTCEDLFMPTRTIKEEELKNDLFDFIKEKTPNLVTIVEVCKVSGSLCKEEYGINGKHYAVYCTLSNISANLMTHTEKQSLCLVNVEALERWRADFGSIKWIN